jgi:hypothetical protein
LRTLVASGHGVGSPAAFQAFRAADVTKRREGRRQRCEIEGAGQYSRLRDPAVDTRYPSKSTLGTRPVSQGPISNVSCVWNKRDSPFWPACRSGRLTFWQSPSSRALVYNLSGFDLRFPQLSKILKKGSKGGRSTVWSKTINHVASQGVSRPCRASAPLSLGHVTRDRNRNSGYSR